MKGDERGEAAWKWVLRILGVIGFLYLLAFKPTLPVAFYVLLGGLLGLPNVIAYQIRVNRENAADEPEGSDKRDGP